jgi:hypothetical protein
MADVLTQVEKGVLTFVVAELKANEATVEAWIAAREAQVIPALSSLIKSIPAVRGIYGTLANPLLSAVEAGVEAYVADLLSKESPQVVFGYLVSVLEQLEPK